jgi:hypothetical protein
LALFAVSMLTYEAAAALIPLSGLVYLAAHSWRVVRRFAVVDFLFGLGLVAVTYHLHSHGRQRPGISVALRDLPATLHQLVGVGTRAVDPFTGSTGVVVAVLLVAVLVRLGQLYRQSEFPTAIRRSGLAIAGAALAAVVAVLPFAGSGGHPLDPGINNRGNILVALPIVVGVVALANAISFTAMKQQLARRALAACLLVVIATSYAIHVRADASRWDAATAIQHRVLRITSRLFPHPPPQSATFVVGYPAMTAPGVPTFSQIWDLGPALSLHYDQPVGGYPMFAGARLDCMAGGVYPISPPGPYDALHGGEGSPLRVTYRRAFLIDAAGHGLYRLKSRFRCQRIARELRPGPFIDIHEG